MAVVINGTTGITTPTYNGSTSAEYLVPVTAFKNRIINGAMVIDQRNAGAAVASPSDNYTTDRWYSRQVGGGVASAQQSSTAPAGFVNSLYLTVTTADSSIAATDRYYVAQFIEGTNIADLAWGSASAKTVTLSFWVQSSVTGTYGGALKNSASNRSYPFTYTINAANTWEQKSITVAGDTTGTWLTTTGIGIFVGFGLGVGSTYSGTAGSWAAADYLSATGATNWISTLNATWYITGVQLEVGSTATSFDYRPYGTELALCQRYYERVTATASGGYMSFAVGQCYGTTTASGPWFFSVIKRAVPTINNSTASGFAATDATDVSKAGTALTWAQIGQTAGQWTVTVASGLVAGNATRLLANNNLTAYIEASAEL